jgi:hypothetical protein
MTQDGIRHGTYGGLQAHKVRGEDPCFPCLRAGAAYMKAYRNRDKCAPGLGWPLRSVPVMRRWGK